MKLTDNAKVVSINWQQFLSSLISNIQNRMFTTRVTDGCSCTANDVHPQTDYTQLLEQTRQRILARPSTSRIWESCIADLCVKFRLPQAPTLNAFGDFVDCGDLRIPLPLKSLMNSTLLIPCSSADCERGFSHTNLIITFNRSQIHICHVSSLMFLKLQGPPLRIWNPSP